MRVLIVAPGADCARRVPVLACADALRRGAAVDVVEVGSDAEVDAALSTLDGARLVVAGGDGPLRAVVRRLVRRALPRPGQRPDGLPDDRTVPDLPPLGLLPLEPAAVGLVSRLGLPDTPEAVAAAVLDGASRRLDLLRHDGGSVTLHGALLGGVDAEGRPVGWRAWVEVDDATLSDGAEPLLACAVANADGYATVAGLPLVVRPDPADGVLNVGVAVPGRRRRAPVEVRRASGRAVTVHPEQVPLTDDGVEGTLQHRRTWWMERSAWAVYAPAPAH